MRPIELNCHSHRPAPGFAPYSVDGPRPNVIFPSITAPPEQVGNYVIIRPVVQGNDGKTERNRVIDPDIVIRVRESRPDNFMGEGITLGGGYMLRTWENIADAEQRSKIHHYHLTLFPRLDSGIDSQIGEALNGSAKGILDRLPFRFGDKDIGEMAKQVRAKLLDFLSKELVQIEVSPHNLVIVISGQPLVSVSEGEITINNSFFMGRHIENTDGNWHKNKRYRSVLSGPNQLLELNAHEIPTPKKSFQIVTGINFPELNYYDIVLPITGMVESGEIDEDKLRGILNPYISLK